MKNRSIIVSAVLSLGLLSACGSAPKQGDSGGDGALAQATQNAELDEAGSMGNRAPLDRVIYFDFDKSEIRPECLDVVAQHGRFLAQNPEGRVRLEGHTDERGAREYNIALGEARAKSIARMLQLQGVSSAQTRSISYGEELPVDEGHNNAAWAKNRRVHVIYEVGNN